MNNFFVTLPSNVLDNPNNTQSNYTTLLPQPISLNGDYEVALTEVSYSPLLNVEFGHIKIPNPYYKLLEIHPYLEYEIFDLNGIDSSLFFTKLNQDLRNHIIVDQYRLRYQLAFESGEFFANELENYYKTFNITKSKSAGVFKNTTLHGIPNITVLAKDDNTFEVFAHEYSHIKEFLITCGGEYNNYRFVFTTKESLEKRFNVYFITVPKDKNHNNLDVFMLSNPGKMYNECHKNIEQDYNRYLNTKQLPYFSYKREKLSIFYNSEISLKLTGILSDILNNQNELVINDTFATTIPNSLNIINYAAIYTDIIDDQYVGNTLAPIIRIINIKSSDKPETVTYYENPHYVPVKKSILTSINISIRDLQGNKIFFHM